MSGPRRLVDYDYASPGSYFVTICILNMEHRFGEVNDAVIYLNDAGKLVAETWESNVTRYLGVELDEFIVMPNHLHGIIHIGTDPNPSGAQPSLPDIVGTFKSLSSVPYASEVRSGRFPPFVKYLWQRSFYDRIVRDQCDLESVREYIAANPADGGPGDTAKVLDGIGAAVVANETEGTRPSATTIASGPSHT